MQRMPLAAIVATLGSLCAAPTAGAISSGICDTNGGHTVRVCVFQDASAHYVVGGAEYIDVTGYHVRVFNLDPRNVVLSAVLLRAIVSGPLVQSARQTFAPIRSGRLYAMAVPWSARTTRVTRDGTAFQAGNARATFYFRGRKQMFQTSNVCAGLILGLKACNE